MPSWNDLLNEIESLDAAEKPRWLIERLTSTLNDVGELREGRHVAVYGSAFLQKPEVPAHRVMIQHEDINGFMSVIHGMTWDRGVTLILHTPGGSPNAAESIVSYLRSKFEYLEVIVPTFAMSAGTMVALAAQQIVMGRHSQLGPIDPQFVHDGRQTSARSVVDQFREAEAAIAKNVSLAHVWAPILQSHGPALLQEARNALAYSQSMVAEWLKQYMFDGQADGAKLAEDAAKHFNDASVHKSHGRRIDRDEARAQQLKVTDLEDDQVLQEAVLTAYHLMTLFFEQGPLVKLLATDTGRSWAKNFLTVEQQMAANQQQQQKGPHRPKPPQGKRRGGSKRRK